MIGHLEPRGDFRRAVLATTGRILRSSSEGASAWHKILVVRPDHLGDLLFLTPALRALRTALPTAVIVGLVGPWGRPVLEHNTCLDRLIEWEFPWFDRRSKRSPLAPYQSLARLAAALRRERFDVVINFRADFWWGALAARLAGIPVRIGYSTPITTPFLTGAIPLEHGRHAAVENLALVESVVGKREEAGLEFPLIAADRARGTGLLRANERGRPIVALQVGAGAPVKVWPLDRLAKVGRMLGAEYDVAIVVVGGPSEVEAAHRVRDAVGDRAIALAGVTTLGELGAVLERCALAIGPDSGPLHLAVAVGTPTLHLFGPADSRRFGPYGDPAWHQVVATPRRCAPCNRLDFAGAEVVAHDCVGDITTEIVLGAARDLLARSLDRPGGT
ncbi:MAG TPA: glycosyltransferase family 9 protein [Chloroflexota bacterium]|nr:glycosyltransferase family 9 protein [Chloroflexota bacterium]